MFIGRCQLLPGAGEVHLPRGLGAVVMLCVYMYMYMYMCVYIYIYRERDIYTCVNNDNILRYVFNATIFIHIYIYIERERDHVVSICTCISTSMVMRDVYALQK